MAAQWRGVLLRGIISDLSEKTDGNKALSEPEFVFCMYISLVLA